MKVIVLGGSGMLGSALADVLSRDQALKVTATARSKSLASRCRQLVKNVNWVAFDANNPDIKKALNVINGQDWVINAIGITKPLVHDDNPFEVERAININSVFPYHLARKAGSVKARVIQIATDCVYSGKRSNYAETDEHDPLDVYGKSKSLGEIATPDNFLLRCSIIGPEPKEHKFLLDWFIGQPANAKVSGYVNHRWNGVTTLHFAKICRGIIERNLKIESAQHIIPAGDITKYEMLQSFARNYHREDIVITPADAPVVVNRTLRTNKEKVNQEIWTAAGYPKPPAVPEMIAELSAYDFRLTKL